jgi:hypothetical protein
MEFSLSSCHDLTRIFGSRNSIPDNQVPPTLIYTPTRHLNGQSLKVVHEVRKILGGHKESTSAFTQRFYSCTGGLDKINIVEGFEASNFPVICCTMALGLVQKWTRVQVVVHIGRGDPLSICQMRGRCGRGEDNPILGIMLVEKTRLMGKNENNQFPNHEAFSNSYIKSKDNCMDAFAITPMCLRVALALENQ